MAKSYPFLSWKGRDQILPTGNLALFRFHTCFGWLPFWDWLYGTDAAFEKSPVHFARDIRLHTLKSAREVIPDDYGKKKE